MQHLFSPKSLLPHPPCWPIFKPKYLKQLILLSSLPFLSTPLFFFTLLQTTTNNFCWQNSHSHSHHKPLHKTYSSTLQTNKNSTLTIDKVTFKFQILLTNFYLFALLSLPHFINPSF